MTRGNSFEYFTVLFSRKLKMNYVKRLGDDKYAAKIKEEKRSRRPYWRKEIKLGHV